MCISSWQQFSVVGLRFVSSEPPERRAKTHMSPAPSPPHSESPGCDSKLHFSGVADAASVTTLSTGYCVLCAVWGRNWLMSLSPKRSKCEFLQVAHEDFKRPEQRELATLWETGSFYWTVTWSQSCELAAWGSLGRKILLLQCGDGYGGLCLWSPHLGGWGRMAALRSSQPLLQPVPG